jgi:hypothetical protein
LEAQNLVLRAIGGEFPVTQAAVLLTRNRFRAIGGEFPVIQEAVLVAGAQSWEMEAFLTSIRLGSCGLKRSPAV